MIVDDDRSMTALLKTLLELDGYEAHIVGRGADVIPMAERVRPHAIILDYFLVDMQGVQVIHMLRSHNDFQSIPIIVASGMNVEHEVMEAGATVFLGKPYEPLDLSRLLDTLTSSAQ